MPAAVNEDDPLGKWLESLTKALPLGGGRVDQRVFDQRGQRVLATTANRHRDKGVDELFASLVPAAG